MYQIHCHSISRPATSHNNEIDDLTRIDTCYLSTSFRVSDVGQDTYRSHGNPRIFSSTEKSEHEDPYYPPAIHERDKHASFPHAASQPLF